MKRTFLSMACALAWCASQATARDTLGITDPTVLKRGFGAEQSVEAGAPDPAWFDKYGSTVNRQAIPNMQQRWDALKAQYPDSGYFSAKAQCWIDAAREERGARNQWGFVQEALGEADRLLSSMEQGQLPSVENPSLRTVRQVRPDLWAKIRGSQADPKMPDCLPAQRALGCAEVKLSHAGHEAWSRLFGAAKRRVATTEALLQQVEQELQACTPPVSAPAPQPMPAKVIIGADALFPFDSAKLASPPNESLDKLDQLARDIRQVNTVKQIVINGYTDRLGSDAYNLNLSSRRAQTVKAYLAARGVRVPMVTNGFGKQKPVVECAQRNRAELIACLQPNRRVEIEIVQDTSAQPATRAPQPETPAEIQQPATQSAPE